MDNSAFADAIRSWERLLGPEHVQCDDASLIAASTATFATSARVHAILRPGSRNEVQEIVRLANTHLVPVYPISSGRNWGYGSSVPTRDAALIDLSRLNRIVSFDEDLAYVTVEPGVTQGQLHDFLKARGSRLWLDATGAGPDCSVIGNTLERGFGHTPMGDHCSHVCAFEVVLPTGDCLETGFARFPGAKAAPLGRWGIGPSLDGLFSQSNLGIVTRMTVWLMPAPEYFQAFFFMCRDEAALGPVVDALRPLRLDGTLRSIVHIGNDYKVLAGGEQYPWPSATPLSQDRMAAIRTDLRIGYWNGSGGLYGTRAQVREARRLVKRTLRGKVDRLQFIDDRLLTMMGRFAMPYRLLTGWDLRRVLSVLVPVYGLLKGIPTAAPLSSAYWRKKTPAPHDCDLDRDRCGLLWLSPVLPSSGPHAAEVAQLATRVLLDNGFEPQMSISLATERTLTCVITISYDRDTEGEDARALACYRTLGQELMARGYPPYRLSVASMDQFEGEPAFRQALSSIKQALDPRGVLSPGRYER